MSFTPVTLAPGAMVGAGILSLVLGYPVAGWLLIGVPIGLGLLVTTWMLFKAWREPHDKVT